MAKLYRTFFPEVYILVENDFPKPQHLLKWYSGRNNSIYYCCAHFAFI